MIDPEQGDMAQMDEPDEASIGANPVTIVLVVVLAAIWAVMVFQPILYFLRRLWLESGVP
jgi:hypothetical protein